MDDSSDDPRTTRVTRRACRAKCIAAWPAEFAPPTMYTSCPAQAGASVSAEP